MGWKEKEYRKTQKASKQEEGSIWEAEMLKIQGLHRCEKCEQIYRLHEDCCVHCDAPNTNYHPPISN